MAEELIISGPCDYPKTNAEKVAWPYIQYYIGERDQDKRKNGVGEHHWSGAQSLAWYTGTLLRDTMHGIGEYRCRYRGPNHNANTYEGSFYNNQMHGYGVMSYADGRIFSGLYHRNIRWGPGIESLADLRENVGLWNGTRLIRLAWLPPAHTVALDFYSSPVGKTMIMPHRVLLMAHTKNIGDVNPALELIKQYEPDPLKAAEMWPLLYPKHCTDTASLLCPVDLFDYAYYDGDIHTIEVISHLPEKSEGQEDSHTNIDDSKANLEFPKIYYAWNNNAMIIHMMKHSFKHKKQIVHSGLQLTTMLTGTRSRFKDAAQHELDCRTLLMASYLGHIKIVAPLVNESNVHPNVTDALGNSAIMYAACGDQPKIIHFLVDAGTNIDDVNDYCCTPLGVTLLRYACTRREISPSAIMQAILPHSEVHALTTDQEVREWNMKREFTLLSPQTRSAPNKISKLNIVKETNHKKKERAEKNANENMEVLHSTKELNQYYQVIKKEFVSIVNEMFDIPNAIFPIPYLFNVNDIMKEINTASVEAFKKLDKNSKKTVLSKLKEESKISKVMIKPNHLHSANELDLIEKNKREREKQIMTTILQLLSDGADPRKVKCPYSSMFIAVVAGCPDLVSYLAQYGADANKFCSEDLGYTPLDVVISGPLTLETVDVARSLLKNGAIADHRLPYPMLFDEYGVEPVLGPTLLHAVLAKKVDTETEEDCRMQLIELLLQYGCNPLTQFRGRSPIDIALSKNLSLLEIFIKSPTTNLNGIINEDNQTILVKMFYMPYCHNLSSADRIEMLTSLLLFGADPLLKCQNGDTKYDNLFAFARNTMKSFDASKPSEKISNSANKGKDGKKTKPDIKTKKPEKSQKEVPLKGVSAKNKPGGLTEEFSDYKQVLDLVADCARLLYIRWLQARLMKDLVDLVAKYQHRHWNIIINEHKKAKSTGLWLTPIRCLEIWDILKTTKKKVYHDRMILKYVLCIVQFCNKKIMKLINGPKLTFTEKGLIETEVVKLLHEHKWSATMASNSMGLQTQAYVTPELTFKDDKFNVCFECILPLKEEKFLCSSCKLIFFCSSNCMQINNERPNCHPCSEKLTIKHFERPEKSEIDVDLL